MSRAQDFLQKESLSPSLRNDSIEVLRQLKRFIDKYKMQLNDEEQKSLDSAFNTLSSMAIDEKMK